MARKNSRKRKLHSGASQGAEARWGTSTKELPEARYGSPDRPLRIGASIEIPCYVLDDGRRVIVQSGMFTALDMKQGTAGRGGGDRLAKFIATKAINPFVPEYLADVIISPIKFRTPAGAVAYGYEATILADMCDAVLAAREGAQGSVGAAAGVLTASTRRGLR